MVNPFRGIRLKPALYIVAFILAVGALVVFWPESKLWHPIAAAGQLLSSVAIFFLTLNFIIESKRENFKDIESAIALSERLQHLLNQWEDAVADPTKFAGNWGSEPKSPDRIAFERLAGKIQDEIVRYSIMVDSGAVNIELVEKYPYLNRTFVNLFIRFDVGHGTFGIRLSPDWELARPLVGKIVDSRQKKYAVA